MEKELENYLFIVEKYLRSMPVSERNDVIKELRSYMEELLSNDNKTPLEIITQLGSPKELAKGYLSDVISKNSTYSLRKFMMIISFYGLTGLSGMFLLPCGAVLSIGLIVSGIIAPIAGSIKAIGFIFGIEVPFIVFQLGTITLHPFIGFILSILMGILFFFSGKAIWRLILKYIEAVSKTKKLYIG